MSTKADDAEAVEVDEATRTHYWVEGIKAGMRGMLACPICNAVVASPGAFCLPCRRTNALLAAEEMAEQTVNGAPRRDLVAAYRAAHARAKAG